jgi:hypothetical protein
MFNVETSIVSYLNSLVFRTELPASPLRARSDFHSGPLPYMSHTVIDSQFQLDSSWVTIICRATRFHITVSYKDIKGCRFGTEYSSMVVRALDDDDEEGHDTLCEWIVQLCLLYLRESTLSVSRELNFQDFYYPQTHHLKLLVSDSSHFPKATRDRGSIDTFHLMIPSRDLPSFSDVLR